MPHILMYTCQIVDHLHGSHASDNSQSFDKLSLPNAYPLLTVLIYLTKSRNYSGATHLDVCVKHNLHQCHLPGIPHYVGCGYFYQIFFFFYIWSVYHSFSHVQVCWGWLCRSWKIEYSALPSTILGKHLYHWTLFWEVNFCLFKGWYNAIKFFFLYFLLYFHVFRVFPFLFLCIPGWFRLLHSNQVSPLVFPLVFPCISNYIHIFPCISRSVLVATLQSCFSSSLSPFSSVEAFLMNLTLERFFNIINKIGINLSIRHTVTSVK